MITKIRMLITIIIIATMIVIVLIIVIPRGPAGDSLISWGEETSLNLVGNPFRDGS